MNHGSDATTVTAVPDAGYQFVSWSDGNLNAARTDTNIQSNLSLTATFAQGAYDAWITAYNTITNPADRVPSADPDKDGLVNSIEFVIGSNPSLTTPGNVLTTTQGPVNVTFQFVRVKAAGDAGFASFIELSNHLGPVSWELPDPGMLSVTDNGTTETVTVTVPRTVPGRLFARVRVVAP